MVFLRVAAGFAFGITFPMVCHENMYLLIATSFLRPHLKYRMDADARDKNLAISLDEVDSYLADVGKSFVLFWLLLGPAVYRTYWLKEDLLKETPQDETKLSDVEDSAVTILKKIKEAQAAGVESEVEPEKPRITFEDYEKLMQQVEKDNRMEQMQAQNPRAQFAI